MRISGGGRRDHSLLSHRAVERGQNGEVGSECWCHAETLQVLIDAPVGDLSCSMLVEQACLGATFCRMLRYTTRFPTKLVVSWKQWKRQVALEQTLDKVLKGTVTTMMIG